MLQPMGTMTGTIRTLRTDKGFGFIKDAGGKDYFFHQSAVQGEGIERAPGGRLGRVRGGGRAEGASRRKGASDVYVGRPLSVDFRTAGRRREIASQRGDELIQIRADVSVESVVVLLRCGNAYQAIDWGRVLGSAASSTPAQVKGGSSTRNVNRTGASQTLSDNDCQLSRITRTVEKRLKTPTRSIR